MTDIIDPQTENAATQDPSAGSLMHVDPRVLILETNVRDDVSLDKQFVASIQEHGVLIPIAAVQDSDGKLWVRAGQRRTLAAREAGLATVPVYVRAAGVGDDKALLIERVAEQIVENDQRRQLTDAQRARGIQQMIDAGASITKVSKKLSLVKDTVKAAAAVGKSDTAMRCLADGQLSLEEAAALTEFEDTPGALNRLKTIHLMIQSPCKHSNRLRRKALHTSGIRTAKLSAQDLVSKYIAAKHIKEYGGVNLT